MSASADILGFTHEALCREIGALHHRPDKGEFHGDAVFRALYQNGIFDPEALSEFSANPDLARKVKAHFRYQLPALAGKQGDGNTYKFLLRLHDGLESESVVIPMRHYKSLCVSSQVGCKMGCRFCETAQMGFLRNLSAGEIVAQIMVARHVLHEPVENVVFMGMGEPLDNFEAVVDAIGVMSDQRGLHIPLKSITVSTVGHVPAILKLAELAQHKPPEGLWRLRLAVSVNAPDDAVRADIMPMNRLWPLAELKQALLRWPLHHRDDFIFVEYVMLQDVNDGLDQARALAEFLRGLRTCVNLIPYNPRRESPFTRPSGERVEAFYHALMEAGQYCRIRGTKGDAAMAACGQLGNRAARSMKREEVAV
jgi:23S rRNA (adenine2503-C2)-methyltransferase